MAFHTTCTALKSNLTVNGVKKAPKKQTPAAPTVIIPAKMSRFLAVGNAPLPKPVKATPKTEEKPQSKKVAAKAPAKTKKAPVIDPEKTKQWQSSWKGQMVG